MHIQIGISRDIGQGKVSIHQKMNKLLAYLRDEASYDEHVLEHVRATWTARQERRRDRGGFIYCFTPADGTELKSFKAAAAYLQDHHGNGVTKAPPPLPSRLVHVSVEVPTFLYHTSFKFIMLWDREMLKMKMVACERMGMSLQEVAFVWQNRAIHDTDTARSIGYVEGGSVSVIKLCCDKTI